MIVLAEHFTREKTAVSIRRFRRVLAIGMTLVGAVLLGVGPVAASGTGGGAPGSPTGSGPGSHPTLGSAGTPAASATSTALTLCHGYGSYLGLGTHRLAVGGRNLLVVEVCGDLAKHTVSMVRDSYIKVDGPRAGSLRFHWRWADKSGAVRGGGDDDNGAFVLDPQSENSFAWPYSQPVAPGAPNGRCVVGVLSEGMKQYVTEPVCL